MEQFLLTRQTATEKSPSPTTRHSRPSLSLHINLLQSEIGPQIAVVMFKMVIVRHSRFCSSQFSPSQASGSGGGSTQMAVPFVTMQTNPSEHSSSLQSRGDGRTRIGLQRTTGFNPALTRTRHSIPSSHSTFSQLVGGGWGTHLAWGP